MAVAVVLNPKLRVRRTRFGGFALLAMNLAGDAGLGELAADLLDLSAVGGEEQHFHNSWGNIERTGSLDNTGGSWKLPRGFTWKNKEAALQRAASLTTT